MFSQNDEEEYILRVVGEKIGTFLDIGAFDGWTFSNTAGLMKKGWGGVLVEPALGPFMRLLEIHGSYENLQLVHAAVGLTNDLVSFWNTNDAVSTTDVEHQMTWKSQANYNNPFVIPQIRIADLIRRYDWLRQVDMVSIDTEGTSEDLYLSDDFLLLGRPTVVCVECNRKPIQIADMAHKRGYKLIYRSSENMVFQLGR